LGVKINPAIGCTGREDRERREERKRQDLLAKSIDTNYMISYQYNIKNNFVDVSLGRG
jgi:hypothetical protein